MIPSTLGSEQALPYLANSTIEIAKGLDTFIVENIRSARRFLRKIGFDKDFDQVHFFELNRHTQDIEIPAMLEPMKKGIDVGLISEAGVPAVADPGSEIVSLAHKQHIKVSPLIGPSSILLALMASGLNGQGFTFHGYLAKKSSDRVKQLKQLEHQSRKTGFTQIFMDTPYRNVALLEDVVSHLSPDTELCLAVNITHPDEKIITLPLSQWRKSNINIHKKPAIFLLLA